MLFRMVAFVVLFTALTKTFVFWADIFHFSVAVTTALFYAITVLLLVVGVKDNKIVYPLGWGPPVTIFVVIAPVVITALTLYFDARFLALNVFYYFLFILTYLLYTRYGAKDLYILLIVSFVVTVFSGLVSVINPQAFAKYADLVDTHEFYGGRAFGFYLQPNSFAHAVNLMYIALIALTKRPRILLYFFPVYIAVVLLSGSRSNLVAFMLISAVLLTFLFKKYPATVVKLGFILGSVFIIVGLFIGTSLLNVLNDQDHYALLSRINLLALEETNGYLLSVSEDQSMSERIKYQEVMLSSFVESPIVGYGIGSQQFLLKQGVFIGAAHNGLIEIIVQGGLLYLCIFIYFAGSIVRIYNVDKKYHDQMGFKRLALFLLLVFVAEQLFFTSVFNERAFYVVLGVFAAMSTELRNAAKGLQ